MDMDVETAMGMGMHMCMDMYMSMDTWTWTCTCVSPVQVAQRRVSRELRLFLRPHEHYTETSLLPEIINDYSETDGIDVHENHPSRVLRDALAAFDDALLSSKLAVNTTTTVMEQLHKMLQNEEVHTSPPHHSTTP